MGGLMNSLFGGGISGSFEQSLGLGGAAQNLGGAQSASIAALQPYTTAGQADRAERERLQRLDAFPTLAPYTSASGQDAFTALSPYL